MKAIQNAVLDDLPDIANAKPWTEDDQPLFDELRQVLQKYDATSRFGITLLHQHFIVSSDEMLVEECDPLTRTLTTRPLKRSKLAPQTVVETNWRFDRADPVAQSCWGVCVEGPGHPKGHRTY